MALEKLKESFENLWESVSEGWQHLRQSAGGALTHFNARDAASVPVKSEVDDQFYFPAQRWAMLGGDVFEDERRFVIRLEIPGMNKDEIAIEIADDRLVVSGDKRFERESSDGRWRVLQCAYGSFRRVVPLNSPVEVEATSASYRNGVLRIELPKAKRDNAKKFSVKVEG